MGRHKMKSTLWLDGYMLHQQNSTALLRHISLYCVFPIKPTLIPLQTVNSDRFGIYGIEEGAGDGVARAKSSKVKHHMGNKCLF